MHTLMMNGAIVKMLYSFYLNQLMLGLSLQVHQLYKSMMMMMMMIYQVILALLATCFTLKFVQTCRVKLMMRMMKVCTSLYVRYGDTADAFCSPRFTACNCCGIYKLCTSIISICQNFAFTIDYIYKICCYVSGLRSVCGLN